MNCSILFRTLIIALAALFSGLPPATAQRAATSPLLVNATRLKSAGAAQQITLKISVRNMSRNDLTIDLEALFVGELVYRGGLDTIYSERKTSAQLKAGESRDFVTESDTARTLEAGFTFASRSTFVKPKGYIARVLADGQLVHVEATAPSLQKAGWDDRALDKLRVLDDTAGAPPDGNLRPQPAAPREDFTSTAPARLASVARPSPRAPAETRVNGAVRAAMEGLAAYYRLDETANATTASDATGGGHDGYFIGGATAGVKGQCLQGVDLDRTGRSFVRVDMPLRLNADSVTLAAWVRRRGEQTDFAGIVFCRGVNTTAGLHFGKQNGLRYTWNGTASTYGWSSGLVVPEGVWTFTALVVEPEQATLYLGVRGEELKSAVHRDHHDVEEFDSMLMIGRDPNQQVRCFDGQIDEVGIWKRALACEDLAALFDQGLSGSRLDIPAGLLADGEPGPDTPRAAPMAPEPPRATVVASAALPAATPPPRAAAAAAMQPPAVPASYQQVAGLYNKTISAYQDYLRDRKHPENLRIIEDNLRICAEGFDDFRKDAPSEANPDSLIEQCNRAIFAVHATRLAPE